MAKLDTLLLKNPFQEDSMDIIKLASKFLPPETQKALEKVVPLLKEQAVAQDLTTVLDEVQKEIKTLNRNPAASKELKNAFNEMANLADIGKTYIKKGELSMMTALNLASRKKHFEDAGKTLAAAYKAKDPAAMAFTESLKVNTVFYDAVKRLVVRGNNSLFALEDLEDGSGNAIELLTGNKMKVHIEKDDYQQVKKAIAPKP